MNWLSYLIQVNVYLLLFYLFYLLILQNETFFRWNRIYLTSSGALSFVIPGLQSEWVRTLFVTEKVSEVSQIFYSPIIITEAIKETNPDFTWMDWALMVYLGGVLLLLARFIWLLLSIKRSFEGPNQAKSFFRKIRVSNNLPARDSILKHEEVHAREFHSADVILFELIAIANWFNPIVYAYKKAIRYIHEFIADEEATKHISKADYALLLLSNVFGIHQEQLTNNFYNESLLKKRIAMLHKTKSRKAALLKYGLSAPLFATMIIFSSATIEQNEIIRAIPKATLRTVLPKVLGETQKSTALLTAGIGEPQDETKKKPFEKADMPTDNLKVDSSLQHTPPPQDTTFSALDAVDVKPEYPGGIAKFYQWIGSHGDLYTKEAKNAGASGRVIMTFIVEKDGSLSNIKAVKDMGYGVGDAAVKVLEKSLRWTPGLKNGKPVRVQYTMPLVLHIDPNSGQQDTTSKSKLPVKRPE
jgi:hypothetical protein